jgi:hypothetical protein
VEIEVNVAVTLVGVLPRVTDLVSALEASLCRGDGVASKASVACPGPCFWLDVWFCVHCFLGLVISWTEDNDDQRLLMMFEGYVYKVTEADSEVESIYSDIRYRSFPRCYDGLCFFSIHFGGRMFIWIYQHKVFLIYV